MTTIDNTNNSEWWAAWLEYRSTLHLAETGSGSIGGDAGRLFVEFLGWYNQNHKGAGIPADVLSDPWRDALISTGDLFLRNFLILSKWWAPTQYLEREVETFLLDNTKPLVGEPRYTWPKGKDLFSQYRALGGELTRGEFYQGLLFHGGYKRNNVFVAPYQLTPPTSRKKQG